MLGCVHLRASNKIGIVDFSKNYLQVVAHFVRNEPLKPDFSKPLQRLLGGGRKSVKKIIKRQSFTWQTSAMTFILSFNTIYKSIHSHFLFGLFFWLQNEDDSVNWQLANKSLSIVLERMYVYVSSNSCRS